MSYWNKYWDRYLEQLSDDDPFRQVGRTLNQQPMSRSMFQGAVARAVDHLALAPCHRVLDLCCGNGLLSTELARHCRTVVAVDLKLKLVSAMASAQSGHVLRAVGDALEVEFQRDSFDGVVIAAAIQQFSQAEVIRLFMRVATWLKPGGVFLVTDALDARCIWNFFDSREREATYFHHTMEQMPVLGTWFDRTWLEKLAHHAGFEQATTCDQPDSYWYSHYRFDLSCRK